MFIDTTEVDKLGWSFTIQRLRASWRESGVFYCAYAHANWGDIVGSNNDDETPQRALNNAVKDCHQRIWIRKLETHEVLEGESA